MFYLFIYFVDGKCELVTVIEAVSATGECHHRATVLLKGKTFQARWLIHRVEGASYGNTEKGWTSDVEAKKWLEGYAKGTKPSVSFIYIYQALPNFLSGLIPTLGGSCYLTGMDPIKRLSSLPSVSVTRYIVMILFAI